VNAEAFLVTGALTGFCEGNVPHAQMRRMLFSIYISFINIYTMRS